MLFAIEKCRSTMIVLLFCSIGFSQAEVAHAQPTPPTRPAAASFATITTSDLAQMLQTKEFTLVNVHVPYEGHIEGTDAFVPFDEITDDLSKLPADKRANIVVYCMSGRMSEIAAHALSQAGYSNVSHVAGGMVDWRAGGRGILNSPVQR
jgi:phage shock protein E